MRMMCATFGLCFKFLTLSVFVSGTKKLGNWKYVTNFVCSNKISDSFRDISCQKALRSGRVESVHRFKLN